MPKFEYKMITYRSIGRFSCSTEPHGWVDKEGTNYGTDHQDMLTTLGNDGWELCAGLTNEMIFKREKPDW